MNPVRVLIVDDHPLMRQVLHSLIEDEADLTAVGEASNGVEAVAQLRALQPDVIVMDLLMPVKDGLTATTEIMQDNPHARILALTSSSEESMVLAAIKAGAMGYVLKGANPPELLQAIREVARGQGYLPASVALKLADGIRHSSNEIDRQQRQSSLTARELDVLVLLGQGLSNRVIAEQLVISEATVRVHLYHILSKLDLPDRNQAMLYAARYFPPASRP